MSSWTEMLASLRAIIAMDVRIEHLEKEVEGVAQDSKEISRLLIEYLRQVDAVAARQERFEEILAGIEEKLARDILANIQTKLVVVESEVERARESIRNSIEGPRASRPAQMLGIVHSDKEE